MSNFKNEINNDKEIISSKITEILDKKMQTFSLKGKGMCNNVYYIETEDGEKYLVKMKHSGKKMEEYNDLETEGKIIQKLNSIDPSLPIPQIIFVSNNPKMYGYKYIEGEMMIKEWESLTENQKIKICKSLGEFHAKIISYISQKDAINNNLQVSLRTNLHPETEQEYKDFLFDKEIPQKYKDFALKLRNIFEETNEYVKFHFIHGDAHHENIIIRNGKLAGIIDFGDAEYGNAYDEFCRYVQDYPDYYEYIVNTYENLSGNKLSRKRLLSYAGICKLSDIQELYKKGKAIDNSIEMYENLLKKAEF